MRCRISLYRHWLWGVFFLLFSAVAVADGTELPRMQGAVTDTAGLLTGSERSNIEDKLGTLREQTGAQIAVLTVKTTAPRDIESYAENVFNQWRLGRINIDDGILLVVAADDRAMRIEVGYGLEGAVSDATANRILNTYFIPEFKKGNYAGGINNTLDALTALVKNEPLPAVTTPAFYIAKQPGPVGWIDIVLGAVLAASAYLWCFFIFSMIKRYKLKAAIPIGIIIYLTWYFGGFNNPAGNGMEFGEDFFYTELPRWSQFIFLKILPLWLVIVLIFTMFIAVVFLFLLVLGTFFWILSKIIKPKKLYISVCIGLFFGGFAFIFGFLFFDGSLAAGVLTGTGFGLFVGIGHYCGFVTVGSGSGGGGSGRGGRGGGGGGFSSGGGSSSSRSSSGGGGRSGGGGSSGRW
ncbi:TPM domain-containing protein [Morganella psychrotolerans]|uniref:TPM domain-containing protein n=1 Tax=Morganella psychrotolerans TaxID=368603 RepID=A0A5M9R8L5_9GAMM|nr:TPM domain-containing protein [Morganella psychrotolerans]KAA8716587.1 TPM domain-containing protein [Morganella psychrotolerans]